MDINFIHIELQQILKYIINLFVSFNLIFRLIFVSDIYKITFNLIYIYIYIWTKFKRENIEVLITRELHNKFLFFQFAMYGSYLIEYYFN